MTAGATAFPRATPMTILLGLLSLLLLAGPAPAGSTPAGPAPAGSTTLIGQSERVYTLAEANTEVRGVAFDNVSPRAPRLFVLDRAGVVFVYRPAPAVDRGELRLLARHDLPAVAGGEKPADPRGLAFAREGDRDVLWFLNRSGPRSGGVSQLVRFRLDDGDATVVDLSLSPFRIGNREALDVACSDGNLLVSFDASGYRDRNLRVQRGILRLALRGAKAPEFVAHLPDCGESPARGLAAMELEGARYLWASAGSDHLYVADGPTGRGLFFLERPRFSEERQPLWGLAFGDDALWVPEGVDGPDRLHRVNVTKNPDAPLTGPRLLRHLTMTIRTEPDAGVAAAGRVFHHYSRPYDEPQLGRQQVFPQTERVEDLSQEETAKVVTSTHDPAGDASSRQYLLTVEYAPAPARACSSRYEIDLWISDYRKCVYPHRVDADTRALAGADWLADDPDLYNLADTGTWVEFFERVTAHIRAKYGVAADLENPYWAARNALEYIQDSYYYPSRPKGVPATVDYDRGHYDGNPGNLKIGLSSRPYDKTQVIACSGTSLMLAGAMRHLGIPARWLGTGEQQGPGTWDQNANGLLDRDETAPCTNGHRYNQVWLGRRYGWVCFDATPTKPDLEDYDPPPPLQSQWRYMERAAGGHRKARRIVFNVGSELFRPLYREFEFDEELAKDNDCGGDQRYNLQGRFEFPERWKLPRHGISVQNSCFVTGITRAGPARATKVRWKLEGHWERDPAARVSVFLEREDRRRRTTVARLARGVRADAGACVVDLSGHPGKRLRIVVRKDGDPETGGESAPFDLPEARGGPSGTPSRGR